MKIRKFHKIIRKRKGFNLKTKKYTNANLFSSTLNADAVKVKDNIFKLNNVYFLPQKYLKVSG